MSECRWSGWPGAWCLDCGREDPYETGLATGKLHYVYILGQEECACVKSSEWLSCENFKMFLKNESLDIECPEPESNRHNPYVRNI